MTGMVNTSLYAAFALCVTPGPDVMFIVAVGSRGGPLTGLTAAVGVACAMSVHTTAAARGLSELFLNPNSTVNQRLTPPWSATYG